MFIDYLNSIETHINLALNLQSRNKYNIKLNKIRTNALLLDTNQ